MRWLLAIIGVSFLWAGPLDDQLLQELRNQDSLSFDDTQMAFIASGAQTLDELADYVTRYTTLVEELSLPERYSQRPTKKKLKEIHRLLTGFLESPDKDNYSLIDLIERRTYSPLTATFLYIDILPSADLHPEDYRASNGLFDSHFLSGREPWRRELVASLFLMRAIQYGKTQVQFAAQSLHLSHLIAPGSQYGANRLDLKLYNYAYDLFQTQEYINASYLAAAAAQVFPKRTEFHALCVNLGIKVCDGAAAAGNTEDIFELANSLLPHTGPHRVQLEERLSRLRFEHAESLFNSQDYEAAINQCETIDSPHDAAAFGDLAIRALEAQIHRLAKANRMTDAEPFFAKLEARDLSRASQLRASLQVGQLQEILASGKMPEALAEASQNVSASEGKDHYLSLLSFYVKTRWDLGQYGEATTVLGQAPATVRGESLVQSLRSETYTNWVGSLAEDDVPNRKRVFRRILSDRSLNLPNEKRREFETQYGHILHEEIKLLIWDDKFAEADQKSNEAMAILPNHQELSDQRQLLDTIMQRVESQ